MNRFENVDVLAALEQLMRQNTAFYRSDFEIDKEIIGRATVSDKAEDKTLLWMSRPSGTHCFRESDVYLQGTRQHNTWKFYGEQTRDRVLAYAVELTGKVRGVIRGNLYELDYPQHFRHVAAEAVQADNIILHYEKGDREQPAGLYFDGRPDPKLGAFLRYEVKPNEPENLREVLRLTFEEAAFGCEKDLPIERIEACKECHGKGTTDPNGVQTCQRCHGTGVIQTQQRTPFGVMQTQQPCSRCGGKGKLVKNPCKVCHGSGKVATKKTLEVSIPMGIDDDQSFALRGMGDAGANGGPSGDVIVMVTVRPDPLFERDGYDIWCEIPITFAQAAMGDDIVVPTVDGKVSYHVPEGTQSGTVFRLRDKGIPALNGRGRGDQYVRVVVEVPKSMTKAQKDKLREFDAALSDKNYQKRKSFTERLRDCFSDK